MSVWLYLFQCICHIHSNVSFIPISILFFFRCIEFLKSYISCPFLSPRVLSRTLPCWSLHSFIYPLHYYAFGSLNFSSFYHQFFMDKNVNDPLINWCSFHHVTSLSPPSVYCQPNSLFTFNTIIILNDGIIYTVILKSHEISFRTDFSLLFVNLPQGPK